MSSDPATPKPTHNLPEYTVGEISTALKRAVEGGFAHVRVRGEVSGFKRHSSGHLYFCLKDSEAVLDAVCWKMQALRLGLGVEDGLEVVCTGRLTTFPGRSKYQMVVERIELAGEGALLKLLEDRKRKLAAEGLFDPARKKALPFLPEVIGVVTSPTGAVIRDILHRLAERFPRRVLLWPVAVQGEGAAAQVAAAIRGFNAIAPGGRVPRPDLLIVARGGGSLEDLWAFNEEVVVRAAAESAIPLISAVGHETDTTLIDYAADLRAPTPTAAAEKAVPVRLDLVAAVGGLGMRGLNGLTRLLDERRGHLAGLARGLPNPRRLVEDGWQRLDDRGERLANSLPNLLHRRGADVERLANRLKSPQDQIAEKRHTLARLAVEARHCFKALVARRAARFGETAAHLRARPLRDRVEGGRRDLDALERRQAEAMPRLLQGKALSLAHAGTLLGSYSYERVLERGFALVRDAAGTPVTSAEAVVPGQSLTIQFADGPVPATAGGRRSRKAEKSDAPTGRQGSLL